MWGRALGRGAVAAAQRPRRPLGLGAREKSDAYLGAALIIIGGCTYVESVNVAMHNAGHAFVETAECGDLQAAFALLTREARSRISYERFSRTPGDLNPVVEAFREAAIITRNAVGAQRRS